MTHLSEKNTPSPNPRQRHTVAVVGVTPESMDIIRAILEQIDVHVVQCKRLEEVFSLLTRQEIDLVALDLEGVHDQAAAFCKQIQNTNPSRMVPIIVLAAPDERKDLLDALRAGADDYIGKPIQTYEVLVRVRSALSMNALREHTQETRLRYGIVSQIVLGMSVGLDIQDAFPPVLPYIARLVGADFAFMIIVDRDGREIGRIFPLNASTPPEFVDLEDLIPTAMQTRRPLSRLLDREVEPNKTSAESTTESQLFQSALLVPLQDRQELLGVLGVVRIERRLFTPADIESLSIVGNALALSSSRARWLREMAESHQIIQQEMDLLGRLQKLLLPQTLPEIPGLAIQAFYHPALAAGGDYYDVIQLTESDIAIVIADVSGHGAPAAMNMGIARSILHTISLSRQTSPKQTVVFLNKLLCRLLGENAHITMFYGVLNVETWSLRWCSAGHVPGLLLHVAKGGVSSIAEKSNGPPLGWWSDAEFDESVAAFDPGDCLLLFTDGILEAVDGQGNELQLDGVRERLKRLDSHTLSEAIQCVVENVERHIGDADLQDDLTILGLQRINRDR